MGDDPLGNFNFEDDSWTQEPKQDSEKYSIDKAVFEEDSIETSGGLNIAHIAEEHAGKSLLYSLIGYLNTKYFDKFDVKTNFPKTYELIKQGIIYEVEKLMVIDLDNSYKKLSHKGIFGRLVKPLYVDNAITRTTIKIPKRQIRVLGTMAKEEAANLIDATKIKIENTISSAVADNPPTWALAIDSMSSYDELLNDKFRITYERVLAKEDDQKVGSSLKGVKQAYWQVRNGWWIETLRDKRSYEGWQIDTYKMEDKPDLWLDKEIDSAKKKGKDPSKIKPYKIQWAPKTEFDLDMIFWLETYYEMQNDNPVRKYRAVLKNRFNGKQPIEMRQRINYPENKRQAYYHIIEAVAPYLLGEVEDKNGSLLTDDDLW